MAIASLSRFTVPLPGGGDSNPIQGLLMPKLKYRFRVSLENFGVDKGQTTELTKQVVSAARPQVQFENQTIHVYNSQIKYAGKHTWQPMNLVLRDDSQGQVTKLVGQQLQKQFDFLEQASAASGADYKFLTRIEMLDGGNGDNPQWSANVLETWEVYGCYLQSVNYNELAYSESTPMEIALTIEYDNALQIGGQGGLGATIARTLTGAATGGGR